jgi:hypothetical protein
MLKKTRKIVLMGGVLAAVSFGGSALAAAGAAPVQPTHTGVAAKATTPKAADKETADGTTATAQKAGDTETADGTPSTADTETADGGNQETGNNQETGDTETADGANGESGSEVPGNDGPGGHADEPGNPNAQNQE